MKFFWQFFLSFYLLSISSSAFSLSQSEKDKKLFDALSEIPSRTELANKLGYRNEKVYPEETWVKIFWRIFNKKTDENLKNYLSYYFKNVKEALDLGADPNAKWKDYTPLYIAVTRGHYDVVKILIEKGAHIDETFSYRDYKNTSLLFILLNTIEEEAFRKDKDYRRIFLYLLNSGINKREGTIHQKPIHIAALICKDSFYLKHLIRLEVNPFILDAYKKNVFDILNQLKKDNYIKEEKLNITLKMIDNELKKVRNKKRK